MRRPFAAMQTATRTSLLMVALIVAACASPAGSGPASSGEPSPTNGGGAGSGSSPGTTLTACEIVTPADIDTALGLVSGTATEGRLTENPSEDEPYANECSYLAQPWGGMVVQVVPSFGLDYYGTLIIDLADRAETLAIGDGGLWVGDLERGYFLKGTVLVTVTITRLVEPMLFRAPTVTLGEAAVARL